MSLKSGNLKIALVDYVLNMFQVSDLFDTFSDVLDKRLLSDFVLFDSRIETNLLTFVSAETEIIKYVYIYIYAITSKIFFNFNVLLRNLTLYCIYFDILLIVVIVYS